MRKNIRKSLFFSSLLSFYFSPSPFFFSLSFLFLGKRLERKEGFLFYFLFKKKRWGKEERGMKEDKERGRRKGKKNSFFFCFLFLRRREERKEKIPFFLSISTPFWRREGGEGGGKRERLLFLFPFLFLFILFSLFLFPF